MNNICGSEVVGCSSGLFDRLSQLRAHGCRRVSYALERANKQAREEERAEAGFLCTYPDNIAVET